MESVLEIQDGRMRKLAESPDNLVYEFTFDQQQREGTPNVAIGLARGCCKWRQENKHLTDDEARYALVEGRTPVSDSRVMTDFAREYARSFQMVTNVGDGPRHLRVMTRLAQVAEQAQAEDVPVATATMHVNRMLQEECARGPAPSNTSSH
jgi:hypothetical protein